MQNGEIIPALIARIRQNNTDNVIIRSKLYNLLNNVTSKFNDVTKATPHIVDFQNMSKDKKVIPKCSNCERWGTMECPNSFYCYSTKTKPFFKPKQDE